MNLSATIELFAGGPGSGCNPAVGRCGRLPSYKTGAAPNIGFRKYDHNLVGGFFKPGGPLADAYLKLADGKWHDANDIIPKNVAGVVKDLIYQGRRGGLWTIEKNGLNVRMIVEEDPYKKREAIQNPRKPPPKAQKEPPENLGQKAVGDMSPIERTLMTLPVKSSEPLRGGNVNVVKKVVFTDGTKGVFKPDDKDDFMMRENIRTGFMQEREAGAWVVAKLAGMQDLGTPCVIRKVDGQSGAMLQWTVGDVAHKADHPYDGRTDVMRAAAYDFVIGNEDRHLGNWLVTSGDKLKLIDHGLSFPDKGHYQDNRNAKLIHYVENNYTATSPKTFAQPFVDAKESIVSGLRDVGLPNRAIEGVKERIDFLAKADRWFDLMSGAYGPRY